MKKNAGSAKFHTTPADVTIGTQDAIFGMAFTTISWNFWQHFDEIC